MPVRLILAMVSTVGFLLSPIACAQTQVQDIFGRSLSQVGITLIDWDGYLANPLIKVYVFPPTNAALPGSVTLTINCSRAYFTTPGSVGVSGPSKTISITNSSPGVAVNLSIFPDHDTLSEDYSLTVVFTGANSLRQTNVVPVHVLDLDLARTNDFAVTENFDRDITGAFANSTRLLLAKQAAEDWAYFFAAMNLDTVAVGSEKTFIWSNNFSGGYYFFNTNSYKGFLLYAYGTTNSTHISGGEGSSAGHVQTSGGSPLTIKRSGGFESEIYGNYNTLGWLFLTNDDQWLVSGNLGGETNDFYSIAHHEIGHALIFNSAHPGFSAAKTLGAFTSAAVTNYFGGRVPIDSSEHLNGSIDPESGQGAFGYEYYGNIPRKRWIITKLDLLCAQEVGYTLRSNSAFAPLTFPSNALPPAVLGVPYSYSLTATGGIPIYDWNISSGSLPPGLSLDPFTGLLSGKPETPGVYVFAAHVRDYHEAGAGGTQSLTVNVVPGQPEFNLSVDTRGASSQAELLLYGTNGQHQAIEVSSDLVSWVSLATNLLATNFFYFSETNESQFSPRFYRARITP